MRDNCRITWFTGRFMSNNALKYIPYLTVLWRPQVWMLTPVQGCLQQLETPGGGKGLPSFSQNSCFLHLFSLLPQHLVAVGIRVHLLTNREQNTHRPLSQRQQWHIKPEKSFLIIGPKIQYRITFMGRKSFWVAASKLHTQHRKYKILTLMAPGLSFSFTFLRIAKFLLS